MLQSASDGVNGPDSVQAYSFRLTAVVGPSPLGDGPPAGNVGGFDHDRGGYAAFARTV